MKHILLFIMLTTITACLLTSCKSKTTQSATSQSQMSQSQILEVDDILARADSLTGKLSRQKRSVRTSVLTEAAKSS